MGDVVVMLSDHPGDSQRGGARVPCEDSNVPVKLVFFDVEFTVARRICIRSTQQKHADGFELRFIDIPRLSDAVRSAIAQARSEGRSSVAVGFYFYWVEGAERARLHPGRYGKFSSHVSYASIWQGIRFAPVIARRAANIMRKHTLGTSRYLAAHWRRGDWFLGPHPRKLEQAALADAPNFGAVLRRHLKQQNLTHVFLMTNAPFGGSDVAARKAE